MRELAKFTIVDPPKRMYDIEQNMQKLIIKPQKNSIKNDLIQIELKNNIVNAYKIPKPKVYFNPKKCQAMVNDKIRYNNLYNKKDLTNWVIIYDFKHKDFIDGIVNCMIKASGSFGMKLHQPKKIILPKEQYYSN